jgi:Protein of unknown function (DUF2917)
MEARQARVYWRYEMTVQTVDSKMSTNRSEKATQLPERRLCAQMVERMAGVDRGDAILVTNGVLWVTQEGDPKDYVLSAGEHFVANRHGTVVVEALTDAAMRTLRN